MEASVPNPPVQGGGAAIASSAVIPDAVVAVRYSFTIYLDENNWTDLPI